MKIYITDRDGKRHDMKLPFEHADFVINETFACKCGNKAFRGRGIRNTTHDTYGADAECGKCREYVGVIQVVVKTVFGIEEDEAVLFGRCRVY